MTKVPDFSIINKDIVNFDVMHHADANTTYYGFCSTDCAAETDPKWAIMRQTYNASTGVTTRKWAGGSMDKVHKWDMRSSASTEYKFLGE